MKKPMSETQYIAELDIVDAAGKTIFQSGASYMIPIYQRAFSWTDDEVFQLLDDVWDFEAEHYFLGSLIVNKKPNGVFEVIDGQQRLTALFTLLNYLNSESPEGALWFECRERATHTLANLSRLCDPKNDELRKADADLIDQSLLDCWQSIDEWFGQKAKDGETIDAVKGKFLSRLKKVKLFRIEVPPHTDLNRYFEIMNVRGEQLEQHDVLKARFMEYLKGCREDAAVFAMVWDACRDMSGYVHTHFATSDATRLFSCPDLAPDTENVFKILKNTKLTSAQTIADVIKEDKNLRVQYTSEPSSSYKSIIDFSYFLLHVLGVFASAHNLAIKITLDDKKLLDEFSEASKICEGARGKGKEWFAHEFLKCLLKCRYLFDKYIIKRKFTSEGRLDDAIDLRDDGGKWSLEEMRYSKKFYPAQTSFRKDGEWETTSEKRNKDILMLEACLRVSYTSPRVMNWITTILSWLYTSSCDCVASELETQIEEIAKAQVKEFLDDVDKGSLSLGVNTPHIVLNYLDYRLWLKDRPEDFAFEFRNTVEHWYPQHPSEGTFLKWKDCDRFGNLCLIQRNINSRFSNLAPMSKKSSTFKDLINKGSLKLRIMRDETTSDEEWKTAACAAHEQEMIKVLEEAFK